RCMFVMTKPEGLLRIGKINSVRSFSDGSLRRDSDTRGRVYCDDPKSAQFSSAQQTLPRRATPMKLLKRVSGLVKVLFRKPEMPIPDEDLEWVVRLALEYRRRIKEQQKRCFKS